jgi:hypothetical protein
MREAGQMSMPGAVPEEGDGLRTRPKLTSPAVDRQARNSKANLIEEQTKLEFMTRGFRSGEKQEAKETLEACRQPHGQEWGSAVLNSGRQGPKICPDVVPAAIKKEGLATET